MGNSCSKKSKILDNIMKICSSILVPLMIGFLTIAMAVVQLHIANIQREQDLHMSDVTRWDKVLANYIKDVSELFTNSKYSLQANNTLFNSLLRAKSLTALRQLDTTRKAYLIQFLYDSDVLFVNQNPIDLSGAPLDATDLSTPKAYGRKISSLENIALSDVSLTGASFALRSLVNADFQSADLTKVNFRLTNLENVKFLSATLRFTNFTGAYCKNANFRESDLTGSNIKDDQLREAKTIFLAILPNGTLGRNPSLVSNGDAESNNLCLTKDLPADKLDSWIVNPPGSVGVMSNISSVFLEAIHEQYNIIQGSWLETDPRMQMRRHIFYEIETCAFVARAHNNASFFQSLFVPEHYRTNKQQYHWFIAGFCGPLRNYKNVWIQIHLREFDSLNNTINDHIVGK